MKIFRMAFHRRCQPCQLLQSSDQRDDMLWYTIFIFSVFTVNVLDLEITTSFMSGLLDRDTYDYQEAALGHEDLPINITWCS